MVHVIQVCWQLASRIRTVPSWSCSPAVWHTPLLCVQWKTPDDGQRNCPKHVEFYSKNKFEKLVHLVGFIVRIHHDVRSKYTNFKYWDSVSIWHACIFTVPHLAQFNIQQGSIQSYVARRLLLTALCKWLFQNRDMLQFWHSTIAEHWRFSPRSAIWNITYQMFWITHRRKYATLQISITKIHYNPFGGYRIISRRHTDRQTDRQTRALRKDATVFKSQCIWASEKCPRVRVSVPWRRLLLQLGFSLRCCMWRLLHNCRAATCSGMVT